MRLATFLLPVSFVANAVLIGVLIFSSRESAPGPANADTIAAQRTSPRARDAQSSVAANAAAAEAAHTPWNRIQSDDLPALVARLRAAGFPSTIVRRVISTLVSEKFDRLRLELEKPNLEAPLAANTPTPYMDPKIGAEFRRLQREQTDLLKNLLGENLNVVFADTDESKALLRHQIGDIPPEKIDRLYAAAMEFSEKTSQLIGATNGGRSMINADREKLAGFEKTFREELDKFLTPAEATDFMMHGSMTGGQLRALLPPFQPTEQEYRAIFPIYQAFQQQFPSQASQLSPEQAVARNIAQEQMDVQMKALLGPERAADFKQAIDPTAIQLNRLVARLDLPISAATQVTAIQQDTIKRASAIAYDASLQRADRVAQMTQLAADASARISATLGGPRGLEAYKQYGGQWLQNMVPRPPAPKK